MIPWFEPVMTGGEVDAVKAVLESGYLNDGSGYAEIRAGSRCDKRSFIWRGGLQWNVRHSFVADGLRCLRPAAM